MPQPDSDAAEGSGGTLALEYGQDSDDGQINGRTAEYRVFTYVSRTVHW